MTIQDNQDRVASPERPTKPDPAARDNAGEPTELTLQELEERIAPLTVRKAGENPLGY